MANPIIWFPAARTERKEKHWQERLPTTPDLRLIEGGETEVEAKRRHSEERLARRRRRRNRAQRAAARVPSKSPFGLW
jgi:hypothetical protein